MTGLRQHLERIGLSQYFHIFSTEGFDTWETLLDVTESDLTALNVKLGHRRKLQRAIAQSRGQSPERALTFESVKSTGGDGVYRSDDSGNDTKESSGGHATPAAPSAGSNSGGTKRKYRRHPKADESAPARPTSAYVIFSNQVREELKGQDLSFTEIAKLVGERWQVLSPEVRDACERQAAAAKEKYYNELSDYKKTIQYAQYQQYLTDFKAKYTTPRTEGKRSKLEIDTSTSDATIASSSNGHEKRSFESLSLPDHSASTSGHARSHSNPHARQINLTPISRHRVPSESTSPTTHFNDLVSPTTQRTNSPQSSPLVTTSTDASSYALPHHARGSAPSSAESRLNDPAGSSYFSAITASRQGRGPTEERSQFTPLSKDLKSQRPTRPVSSMPSLVRSDTTQSSVSEIATPGTTCHTSLLPMLVSFKGDRILPPPVPSSYSFVLSSLDTRPTLPQPAHYAIPQVNHDTEEGLQWPALLRATAIASYVDLEDGDPESGREPES